MKAILVIDMSNTCGECLLGEFTDEDDFECETMFCKGKRHELGEELAKHNEKPSWCPLRPLPERMSEVTPNTDWEQPATIYSQGLHDGWNMCRDEIAGETEC